MKLALTTFLLISSITTQAATLQLEPIEDIPNTNNSLTWGNYLSAKELKDRYAVTYMGNKFKLMADSKAAAMKIRLDTCNLLRGVSAKSCHNAILIEQTSNSAIAPVRAYLIAAMQADEADRDPVLILAGVVSNNRMTTAAFRKMLDEVCSEVSCE